MANLLDIIAGITYPEKDILIPTDFKNLGRLGDLELELASAKDDQSEEYAALVKEKADLTALVQSSVWTFTLRGLPSSLIDSIGKSKRARIKDPQERVNEFNREVLITSIIRIVGSDQEPVDFDNISVGKFLDAVPEDVVKKFQGVMEELSGDSLKYEYTVTDPNFS